MTTEQQNKAWLVLTDSNRDLCRNMYATSGDDNVKYLLEVLYGRENLTSKFNVGDKIRYNGFVYEIEALVGKNRYAIKGLNFDLDESDIEPYNEITEPKSDEMVASEFDIMSEPEEEVTIEGVAEKCSDGITRVYIGYVNSFILPCDCNIEGEVTITIKTKKK